jgi:hypothetical protein
MKKKATSSMDDDVPVNKYFRGEYGIFDQQGYDMTLQSTTTTTYHPINPLSDNSDIVFVVPESTLRYTSPSSIRLYGRARITAANGTALANTVVIAPINNFMHSLFADVGIKLNETPITQPSTYYPHRAFIERSLLFSKEFNKTQSENAMYFRDDAPDSTDHEAEGSFKNRFDASLGSKPFEFCGRLHADIFSQGKVLPPGINMRITLKRSENDFLVHTLAANANTHYKVEILEATLMVVTHKVLPTIELDHLKCFEKGELATYDINQVEVKTYTLAANSLTSINENLIQGKLPTRMVVALIPTAAAVGTVTTNPFNYTDHTLSNITVTVNGDTTQSFPMDVDFRDTTERIVLAYDNVFRSLGISNLDCNIDLTKANFKNGKAFFVYEITPTSDEKTPPSYGNVKIELKFRTALTEALTVLVYTETPNTLYIDKHKNVFFKD